MTRTSHSEAAAPRVVVRVLLFASIRERLGQRELEMALPQGATVGHVRRELVARFPEVVRIAPSLSVAVNQEYCGDGAELQQGDEVAIIPPVSGGSVAG